MHFVLYSMGVYQVNMFLLFSHTGTEKVLTVSQTSKNGIIYVLKYFGLLKLT